MEASEQREAQQMDETIIAINEKINAVGRFFGIIRRETGFNFIIIILIIIILTFSIKCDKNIVSDNKQKKWRHSDDVKCTETNYNGKVSKEELTKLMSKLLTGAPWICPFSYSYFKYIILRKSYG